jgi:hypothetical protein
LLYQGVYGVILRLFTAQNLTLHRVFPGFLDNEVNYLHGSDTGHARPDSPGTDAPSIAANAKQGER